MFLLNGQPLSLDTPFECNGVMYPSNWLRLTSLEEKQAIGIVEVDDPVINYNPAFYDDENTPKDLNMLKPFWLNQIKTIANRRLSETDWYEIRSFSRSIPVPSDVANTRTQIITECNRLQSEINSANNITDFIAAVQSQNWPV